MPPSGSALRQPIAPPAAMLPDCQQGGVCRNRPSELASQNTSGLSTATSKNCRGEISWLATASGDSLEYSSSAFWVIAHQLLPTPRQACCNGSFTGLTTDHA